MMRQRQRGWQKQPVSAKHRRGYAKNKVKLHSKCAVHALPSCKTLAGAPHLVEPQSRALVYLQVFCAKLLTVMNVEQLAQKR